jgi:hypothetical protein
MSGSGQGRKPPPRGKRTLVADRRTKAPFGETPGHDARKATKPATRRKRTDVRAQAAPWPARLDRGGLRFVLRLFWGLAWRGGVAVR